MLTVRGNFTYARNMIVDQDQPDYKYLYMNRTGQARYQTFGLVAAGLFRDQADIDAWPKQSFGDVEPGDIKYLDLNGDGVVDSYDVKPIGYTYDPGNRLRIRLLAAMEGIRLLGLLPGRRPRKFLDAHRPDARLHRPQQPRGQPLLRCLR